MSEGGPNSELAPGTVVAGHRIVRPLGAGGFGAVFEAIDLSLDRPVALKLLHGAEAGMMARFRDEARLLARINDPHVIQIYRIDQLPSGQPFLTMELFGTGALGKHVPRGTPAPLHFAVAVVRQVLAALAAAHAGGIVHRDIKEANILVDPARLMVKVCDFGIARAQNPGDREAPATGHAVLGTPHYIAPERFRGIHDDPRSDLYSVGVVFYRMLCGRRPFDMSGASVLEIAHRVVSEDAPAPRGVPPAVARVCLDLLARDPDQRPADAWSAIAALDRAIEGPATELEMAAIRRLVPGAPRISAGFRAVPVAGGPSAPPSEASAVLELEDLGASMDDSLAVNAPTAALAGTMPLSASPAGAGARAATGRATITPLDPRANHAPDGAPTPSVASGGALETVEPTASSAVLAWEATDSALGDTDQPARLGRVGGWWGLGLGAAALALVAWGLTVALGPSDLLHDATTEEAHQNNGLRAASAGNEAPTGLTSGAMSGAVDAGAAIAAPTSGNGAVEAPPAGALGVGLPLEVRGLDAAVPPAGALTGAPDPGSDSGLLGVDAGTDGGSPPTDAALDLGAAAPDAAPDQGAGDAAGRGGADAMDQAPGDAATGPGPAEADDGEGSAVEVAAAAAPDAAAAPAPDAAVVAVEPPAPRPTVAARKPSGKRPTAKTASTRAGRKKPAARAAATPRDTPRPSAEDQPTRRKRPTTPVGEERRKARSTSVYDDPFVVPGP